MLSSTRQDLGFAVRQLRCRRGFTLTAVLTLALGIGATTSVFSLVDEPPGIGANYSVHTGPLR
jgi:putative ABC transport system permease protein